MVFRENILPPKTLWLMMVMLYGMGQNGRIS